jgi:hypothetical protein
VTASRRGRGQHPAGEPKRSKRAEFGARSSGSSATSSEKLGSLRVDDAKTVRLVAMAARYLSRLAGRMARAILTIHRLTAPRGDPRPSSPRARTIRTTVSPRRLRSRLGVNVILDRSEVSLLEERERHRPRLASALLFVSNSTVALRSSAGSFFHIRVGAAAITRSPPSPISSKVSINVACY